MNSRAFVRVHTQYENVGDALIVRELISLLAERMLVTVDLSSCPRSFRAALELPRSPNIRCRTVLGTWRMLTSLIVSSLRSRPTLLFLVPGGRGGELTRSAQFRANLLNGGYSLLDRLGVAVVQIGVSYDRLGPRHSAILRRRASRYAAHFVRDCISHDHLVDRGIRVDGIIPDLALNLFRSPPELLSDPRSMAFSFRTDKSSDQGSRIAAAVAGLCSQLGHGSRMVFVSQVERDRQFMRSLASDMATALESPVSYIATADSIQRTRQAYSGCSWIVSNRLHALLMGMSVGASPIALVDPVVDAKIIGVFHALGIQRYLQPLGTVPTIPPPLEPSDWARIEGQAEQLRRRVHEVVDTVALVEAA